jgi:hypothetical protein
LTSSEDGIADRPGRGRSLPTRPGHRPTTTPWAPHIQQERLAPPEVTAALARRVFALPDAEERPIPRAGLARKDNVMLYGPRDEREADVIYGIVLSAYGYAGGRLPKTRDPGRAGRAAVAERPGRG